MRTILICLTAAALFACGSDAAIGEETSLEDRPAVVEDENPALFIPAIARKEAPRVFHARFETTKGDFVIEAQREWAPRGVDRLYNLIRIDFFEKVAFFRVIRGFIAQFGIHGNPQVIKLWADAPILDDQRQLSNERGTLSFAHVGPNSRTTQIFINLKDNQELDDSGFVPVARLVEGMEAVASIHADYGELHPKGKGPRPNLLNLQGNRYLEMQFPEVDYILSTEIVETTAD